jgi:acyl transferase domain-containing protein
MNLRRASVSSFGYGGTNGHVVIEAVDSLYPWYQHARAKKDAPYDRSSSRPFLICLSAHDKATLERNTQALAKVASQYYLTDLAHTLNLYRTKFAHRAFTVARESHDDDFFAAESLQSGIAGKKAMGIGFLFTGQGVSYSSTDHHVHGIWLRQCLGSMGWHGPGSS